MKLLIMRRGLGVFLTFCLFIFSCSEDEQVMPDMGLDYYPLSVGNYSIYRIEETKISQSIETKTTYELKIAITSSGINEQGVTTYYIVREKRADPSVNWESLDTWSTKVINNRILQNEGNVLFVKLIFPPSLNLSWNGNQFNDVKDNGEIFYDGDITQYRISEFDRPITLSTGFSSDSSLTVIQNDYNDNFTGIDERKEVYARSVGLIYKEMSQIQYCTDTICYGQQKVDKGVILVQSLKEYGKI